MRRYLTLLLLAAIPFAGIGALPSASVTAQQPVVVDRPTVDRHDQEIAAQRASFKPAPADPIDEPITLTVANVAGEVDVPSRVPAVTNGREVRWFAKTPGLRVFPADLLKSSLTAVVWSPNPGVYTLVSYTARGDMPSDPVFSTVTIGGVTPTPVPPPGPAPPGPTPVPPGPTPNPTPDPQPVLKHATFILIDSWIGRAASADLLSLGPEAKAWATIRAAGHTVYFVDNGSALAKSRYPTYVGKSPVLLVYDRDAGDKFVAQYTVGSIADVARVVAAFTPTKISTRATIDLTPTIRLDNVRCTNP